MEPVAHDLKCHWIGVYGICFTPQYVRCIALAVRSSSKLVAAMFGRSCSVQKCGGCGVAVGLTTYAAGWPYKLELPMPLLSKVLI